MLRVTYKLRSSSSSLLNTYKRCHKGEGETVIELESLILWPREPGMCPYITSDVIYDVSHCVTQGARVS